MNFHLTVAIVSLLVMLSGLVVLKIQKLNLTEPVVALLLGMLLGPHALDVLNLHDMKSASADHFMKIASMLTISMALMATAYRLKDNYYLKYRNTQSIILLLIMPLMCLFSGLIAHFMLGLSWELAFLLGAVITPTDPVVSSTIVSGKMAKKLLPEGIRQTISFESGANDGLAYPLVMLMLFMLGYSKSEKTLDWLLHVVVWETLGAIAVGLLLGYLFGKLLHMAHSKNLMNSKSLLSFSIAFGFFTLSFVHLIKANGIIAVFAGALMVNRVISTHTELEEDKVQEMTERLFTVPIFLFLGIFLPVSEWLKMGWPLLAFALLILFFRRIPAFILLKPALQKFRSWYDILLMGWFGPIGVAAIFYSMEVLEKTPYHQVWVMASFVIFISTLVHGFSSLPLSKYYAKKTGKI